MCAQSVFYCRCCYCYSSRISFVSTLRIIAIITIIISVLSYDAMRWRRLLRTCHIVVSRYTCALETSRLLIMNNTIIMMIAMMMIGCKAKAFVAVLSTEVLVIGKTTFTELRMLRAMTYFWPQIFFMSIYGFCRTLPKDVR